MKEVMVLFKSGAKIYFNVNDLNITRNGFGELIELEWNCQDLKTMPLWLNIANIDAIITTDLEEEN